jgi:hypothetical protein
MAPIVLVADLEFSLGVIAACIPTLMPLFKARERNLAYTMMNKGSLDSKYIRTKGDDGIQSQSTKNLTGPPVEMEMENRIKVQQDWVVEHEI